MIILQYPRVVWQSQTPIFFPAVKNGLILKWAAEKSNHLNELTSESHYWLSIYSTKIK
jgi:hypothetical protein